MVSSLQELIAPLTEPEFSEMLRTRSLVFRRGSDEKRFETLLDWDAFRRVIESDFPADKLLVTRDGEPVLPLIYLERGKLNTKILAKLLDQGASLIARRRLLNCFPRRPRNATPCSGVSNFANGG